MKGCPRRAEPSIEPFLTGKKELRKRAHCIEVSKCVNQNMLSPHLVHVHKIKTLCLAICMLHLT